ncbi:NAD(P)-dependent oxidoreductase [Bradyrhizobium niftali]|uniref:NAD(P)-dependent oxidoreductase n=1 Tax=Bradyrhizobium niftali TaxID=2560055 RepID=UPI0024BF5166|nr:NAD(P)-dependent oxidoreductase [Bradyrhizobium niftali]
MATKSRELSVVLNHPFAETFAKFISERFPKVRTFIAPDPERLERYIGEANALLAFNFPVQFFDKAKKLRWFQCTGAGVDSLFPIRDRLANIIVTNARGIHGDVIADYVMGGVTMLHWDFRRFLREQGARQWNSRAVAPLADKAIGVVGLGSIGSTIARRAKSAGMTVFGSKRDVSASVNGVDQLFTSGRLKATTM